MACPAGGPPQPAAWSQAAACPSRRPAPASGPSQPTARPSRRPVPASGPSPRGRSRQFGAPQAGAHPNPWPVPAGGLSQPVQTLWSSVPGTQPMSRLDRVRSHHRTARAQWRNAARARPSTWRAHTSSAARATCVQRQSADEHQTRKQRTSRRGARPVLRPLAAGSTAGRLPDCVLRATSSPSRRPRLVVTALNTGRAADQPPEQGRRACAPSESISIAARGRDERGCLGRNQAPPTGLGTNVHERSGNEHSSRLGSERDRKTVRQGAAWGLDAP